MDLNFLEQAKILYLLYPADNSTAVLQKPEKIFLNNNSLLFALAEESAEKGAVRETFFMSQVSPNYKIHMPKQGDVKVDNKYIFEVGGKSKGIEQIRGLKNSWVVKFAK